MNKEDVMIKEQGIEKEQANMNISQLIPFLKENETKVKINFAIGNEPFNQYLEGKFQEWQENQNDENFNREYILSLIDINNDEWLFAGIYERISVKKRKEDEMGKNFIYETKLLNDISQELMGRLVISFKNPRNSYLNYENNYTELIVLEIKKPDYNFIPFRGYTDIFIEFNLLREIIHNNDISWKIALSSVKGIYLITDRSNGNLYVGSASGKDAIWQRWNDYIENGHGEDVILKEIIQKNGYEYTSNYSFSILEIVEINTTKSEILYKESRWKEKLMTRKYGYNEN